ncbi:DNA primase [Methanosarcinales archaeon]|nr:DNA primase [Methanosarcinales archaeon]
MEIKEILQSLSILSVLEHYGIKPNRNKMVCCPFHDDKNPSMQVYAETNTVFCFSGNCKMNGKKIDAIQFIQDKENINKHEAIKKAQSLINESVQPVQAKPIIQTENLTEIFTKLKQSLYSSSKARAYAESRNIYNAKLEAGYNNGTHYSKLKNCIIFPLKDKQNNIVSYYGRNIESKGKDDRHFYTANRKGLYPNYPNQETETLIITESIIDSATLQLYTTYTSLALYGTNVLNEDHQEAIQDLPKLKEIIFFLNGDEAGREWTKKHSETLHQLLPNITISTVATPDDEDINSLIQGHEAEILTHLIESRTILFSSNETSSEEKNEPTQQAEDPIKTSITTTGKLNTSNADYISFVYENLLFSIIGGLALYPLDKLKITLKIQIAKSQNPLHSIRQSNLDLYSEEQLQRFIKTASEKLEVGSKQLNYAIAELTSLLEDYRNAKIEEQKPKTEKPKVLSEFRKQELQKLLQSKNLYKKLNELIGKTGVIGEEKNRLIMWTVFTSRLTANPLHIICLGASGTGKTYLQERISELIPKPHQLSFTASTENALYYVGKTDLKNKLILIEDMDGANAVLYVLRELQSKGYVSKIVPMKDSKGNMKTILLEVEGPICLSGTTTKERIYEDNANRCLLIYLDNSETQQQSIMQYQRLLSAGKINKSEEQNSKELLQDMQLMFKKINIVNPFADKLIIPESVFKPLRTNAHYLQFIEAITFIHQYQRPLQKDSQGNPFIETTLEDIELANELLKEVLLAKSDELTKACRNFLESLKALLIKEKKQSFFRSDVRSWTRINPDNLRYYLSQLNKYGYIKIVGGNKYKTGFEYEITDKEEYNKLSNSVETALDKALEELRMLRTVANEAN